MVVGRFNPGQHEPLQKLACSKRISRRKLYKTTLLNIPLKHVLIVVVTIVILSTALMNAVESFKSFRHRQNQSRELLAQSINQKARSPEKSCPRVLKDASSCTGFPTRTNDEAIFSVDKLKLHERYKLIEKLRELSQLPISKKRKTLIYIPKSNELFWKSLKRCKSIPFLAPAISGIAMLAGLPDVECETLYYGYAVYKDSSGIDVCRGEAETICRQAVSKGFSEVIILDEDVSGDLVFRKLGCVGS